MTHSQPDPHDPRSTSPTDTARTRRAELERYFAWGYLSRRELNTRLRALGPATRLPPPRPAPRAA